MGREDCGSFPDLPDGVSWSSLADEVENVLGVTIEAFIEENQRYIVRAVNLGLVEQLFYLRLSFQHRSSEETGEAAWIKLDYLVLDESLRRRGLGRRVVELTKAWIGHHTGIDQLCLFAREEVDSFWSKCGFSRLATEQRMHCFIDRGPILTEWTVG